MIYPIDLSKLYQPYHILYEKAFSKCLEDGYYIGGSAVDDFEHLAADYLGANYVVGCGNGTHALELALIASGVGTGDEVITVANTYYATARSILDIGAKPVFCDVNKDGLIDTDKVLKKISIHTKAIIPVHLYGAVANLDILYKIGKEYNLAIIEDCSHAFGSLYKGNKVGHDSQFACFSLYPTKNIGAMGDAGMIAVRSKETADKLKSIRYFTDDKERDSFAEHSLHSRMDSLQARLLQVSLTLADSWNNIRQEHSNYYKNAFSGLVPYVKCLDQEGIVPYVFPVIVSDQKKFMRYMADKGVVTQIHYHPMLHKISHLTQRYYELPVTEYLNSHTVSIPVSQTVTQAEIEFVANCVLEFFKKGLNQ